MEEFRVRGYLAARTKTIAVKAGVNEVTLFRHFGNKENLFREVLHQHLKRIAGRIAPELPGPDAPVRERLLALARHLVLVLEENRSTITIILRESSAVPAVHASLGPLPQGILAIIAAALVREQKDGYLRPLDPAAAAHAFVAPFFTALVFLEPLGVPLPYQDREEMVLTLVDLFLAGMQTEKPPAAN